LALDVLAKDFRRMGDSEPIIDRGSISPGNNEVHVNLEYSNEVSKDYPPSTSLNYIGLPKLFNNVRSNRGYLPHLRHSKRRPTPSNFDPHTPIPFEKYFIATIFSINP